MWKELDLKEIQDIQYEMLCVFDDYCKKHHLKYYLDSGTLLGAIRHQDFIPWDDDMDTGMPRPDYDKFLEVAREDKLADDILVGALEYGNLEYPFLKLFRTDTKVYIKNTDETGGKHIWIDVFPLDGLPSDEKENRKIHKQNRFLGRLHGGTKTRLSNEKNGVKKIGKFFASTLLKLYGGKRISEKMMRNARRYDYHTAEREGNLTWGGIQGNKVKEYEHPMVTKTFRGREFPVHPRWEEWLTNMYGEYLKLPPLEKRTGHGYQAWKWE